jgi:hypothetical protein
MTLDSRGFFAAVVSFLFRRIRIFNALGVHYAEACLLFPTIVGTDLSNYFLTLDQVPNCDCSGSQEKYRFSDC